MALEDHGAIEGGAGCLLAADHDDAGIRVVEPGEDVEDRRLPAARMADQADEFALRDAEMHVFEYGLNAATRLGWSARGVHRTLRVARTIADLAGSPMVTVQHLAEAMQYRPKPNAN